MSGRLARRLGLADLESGNGLGGGGGGAGDVGEDLVAVVDAEGGIGVVDGDGAAGVADDELDLLPGDGDAAAAADSALDPQRFDGGWGGGPAGRASRMPACSVGLSGLGRLRSGVRSASRTCRTPRSRRAMPRRPARW
jgi:hypothetical protein